MRELDVDLSTAKPRLLTEELISGAALLITMGCGEACPVVPGVRREDWPLADPKGQSPEHVRAIRDEIRERVWKLLLSEGWSKLRAS
jgi:arsenate reductase